MTIASSTQTAVQRQRSSLRTRLQPVRGAGTLIAALVLALFVFAALFPGAIASHDPAVTDRDATLAAPSSKYLLGTDEVGRDVMSRIVYGTSRSLYLGVGAVALAVFGGVLIGLVAGLAPRLISQAIMRLNDIGTAFPELLLAILFVALFGVGLHNAVLAIGIAGIPYYARVVRAETITVRSSAYVEAARSLSKSRWRVLVEHILPNALRPVVPLATIGIGGATLAGASLSFLGLGSPPPTPEWGSMLASARDFLTLGWWAAVFPGIALIVFVVSTAVLGRGMQRMLEGR